MDRRKARFYKAEAVKIQDRRRWQTMGTWALVAACGERLQVHFEYRWGGYSVDLYVPALRVAIEIDEPHHAMQQEQDGQRQAELEEGLGCTFYRVLADPDNDGPSLFEQMGAISQSLIQMADEQGVPVWQIEPPAVNVPLPDLAAGYSARHVAALQAANIPALVQEFRQDLAALGIHTTDDKGPVQAGNGELGFSVPLDGITFVVNMRANHSVRLIVTQFEAAVPDALGLVLDGPRRAAVPYWVIQGFGQRYTVENVLAKIVTCAQILSDG
jgi:very-short-patch-repair endonuclease